MTQLLEARLIKIFPGIQNFFTMARRATVLDGKVWIPQISNDPPTFARSDGSSLHSNNEQSICSTLVDSTLKRQVSSRIADIHKIIILTNNKTDFDTKQLPPIPTATNNRPVYGNEENIYEELNPVEEPNDQDYDYFTDSDFDTTDDEDDDEAVKDKLNSCYEGADLVDSQRDPRLMLQKVLLLGVQKQKMHFPSQNNCEGSRSELNKQERYDVTVSNAAASSILLRTENLVKYNQEPSTDKINVSSLIMQIKALEKRVIDLTKQNECLDNRNIRLQKENETLKMNMTTTVMTTETSKNLTLDSRQRISRKESMGFKSRSPSFNENWQPKNLKETIMFFESIQH